MKRTSTYIATIPMVNEVTTIEVKKVLEQIFGWVRLRGRHKDRKSILGNAWHKWTQNDIPWRKAQYIDIYLHPKNPNYKSANKGLGIQRQNLSTMTKNLGAVLGRLGIGYAEYQSKIDFAKSVNKKVNSKLQPGDWGYYVQELIDFVERNGSASHTELHNHYKKITGGSNSFSHCLINLRNPDPNRRCRRYIEKQGKRFCSGNYIVKYL
jgi:hypothetical protein